MKSNKRAQRRHNYSRLKSKRIHKKYWGRSRAEWTVQQLGLLTNTPKICSCYMCGNPRKYWKESPFQEKKLLEKTDWEIKNLLNT